MSTTDMKGPESTGDAAVNEAVGHAAGAAPVAAQTTVDEADVPAAPELEEENLSLPGQETSAAHAALNRGARKRSFEVSDHEVPKSHVEEWRFTPLRRFAPLFQDVATDDSAVEYQVEVPEGASEPRNARDRAGPPRHRPGARGHRQRDRLRPLRAGAAPHRRQERRLRRAVPYRHRRPRCRSPRERAHRAGDRGVLLGDLRAEPHGAPRSTRRTWR